MVELQHGSPPQIFLNYLHQYPQRQISDFDSQVFQAAKKAVKTTLNDDQGGLCVYCERRLEKEGGQVDHIKPKTIYPHLTFVYTNYAQSCIDNKTCGQKKKAGILPIEPAVGCNVHFAVMLDGTLEPCEDLTRREKHNVRQTRDMLGLNNPKLVRERKEWVKNVLELKQQHPALVGTFLVSKPFRHILKRI